MDVAGNIGGLIFAVGSVLIVAVGLPSVMWFLLVATIAGCFVAWALARWRTSHPYSGRPAKGIGLR
jgi:predicted branched-subunit amino acid permease